MVDFFYLLFIYGPRGHRAGMKVRDADLPSQNPTAWSWGHITPAFGTEVYIYLPRAILSAPTGSSSGHQGVEWMILG